MDNPEQVQKIDETQPGPETQKWIQRVSLLKTLLLDCRDPAYRSRKKNNDYEDHSNTGKTVGPVQLEKSLNENNYVENLVDDSDDSYIKNGGVNGSGSTLNSEYFLFEILKI